MRVAVALVHEGRLLVQGDERYPFVVPPGGRCQLHETTSDAARREVAEELGCSEVLRTSGGAFPSHTERVLVRS